MKMMMMQKQQQQQHRDDGNHQEIRKGPWTEQEDFQLACFVGLFGDRRWDFIAKVSGLNRTGKSCRLRWVNYLHPDLKRGKITPHEERLVLQLHSKWGNRWSKIARKLPGRTDNEIKNYWRTHMRKKAQEKKLAAFMSPSSSSSNCCLSSSSSSSNCCSSSSSCNHPRIDSLPYSDHSAETEKLESLGGLKSFPTTLDKSIEEEKGYSMDEIWKDIDTTLSEKNEIKPTCWNYCSDSIWAMYEEENKMFLPIADDQFFPGI